MDVAAGGGKKLGRGEGGETLIEKKKSYNKICKEC